MIKTRTLQATSALTTIVGFSIACAAGIAAPAAAQDAPPAATGAGEVGDIVVTAQRREQSLQKVPIAITAVTGAALRSEGITRTIDVVRLVPGVSISASSAGENSQYTMRGVTQNDYAQIAEGPIAVYVDDSYIPNLQGGNFGFFDLARVEVLKGPQGILFGRNATGGLVHYIINKPSAKPEGYAEFTYGSFNQTRFEGAVGGPISDTISARASFLYDRNGAIWKNKYPDGLPAGVAAGTPPSPCCSDLGQRRNIAGRLQIQAKPADGLTIRLMGSIARQTYSTAAYSQVGTQNVLDGAGHIVNNVIAPADVFGFVGPSAKDRDISVDLARKGVDYANSNDVNLHIDYDLGFAKLVSITSYRRFWNKTVFDADASPVNFLNFGSKSNTSNVSEEIRLQGSTDKLNWTTGIFLLKIKSHANVGLLGPAGSLFADSFGLGASGVDLTNDASLRTHSASIFGQLEYKLTPELTLIGGLRGIVEKQKFAYSSGAFANVGAYEISSNPANLLFALGAPYSDRRTQHLWSGKIQLQYEPTTRIMIYAGVNRGVKGGNYNVPLAGSSLADISVPYKAEALIAYEAGSKMSFWGGKARLNTSLFYYDYRNYQAYSSRGLTTFVLNKPAKNYGGEVSLSLRPVRNLTMDVGFSAFHARVKDISVSPGLPEQTVHPTFAPERQLSAQATYTIPHALADGDLSLSGNVYHTQGFFTNNQNFSSQYLPGYTLVGASVRWQDANSRFSLALVANNIFDKRYGTTLVDLTSVCGCSEKAYGQPRWLGVTLGYRH